MKKITIAPSVMALSKALEAIPGFGPKSAQRAAFYLLQQNRPALHQLKQALTEADRVVTRCRQCNTLSETELCPICESGERDTSHLCVVESVADEMALESSLSWPGQYFVLAGRLNPIEGIGPEMIGMDKLLKSLPERIEQGLLEVVIATSYTPEGDATAYYLIDTMKKNFSSLRVTRLARGLPSGIEIEYTDLNTLANAIYARKEIE